jgi:hypothetical protein
MNNEFGRSIFFLTNRRLGVNARSLLLVLKIELIINGDPKILYEGIYQGDEVVVQMWSAEPGLGHYQWLCGPLFQIFTNHKMKLRTHYLSYHEVLPNKMSFC